jgi:hypothetical protein
LGERPRQANVSEQPQDRCDEGFCLRWRDQKTGGLIAHEIGNATDTCGDHRAPRGHGFDDRER